MIKVFIKKDSAKNILTGHPWIFSGAIEKKESFIPNGELCEIYCKKNFIGIGYYNNNTDIALRILTRKKEKINENFFINRFLKLKEEKERYLPKNTNAFRIVFAESDLLPGLIVDKYNKTYVIQFHTLGISLLEKEIVSAIINVFHPQCIYEKTPVSISSKEGFQRSSKILFGKFNNPIIIKENSFNFEIDIEKGQKTGFFLDQRENRKAIIPFIIGKKVLNCFCYTGGFSVYSVKYAKQVSSIDISKGAINQAKRNFIINNFDVNKHQFLVKDVFDYLKEIPENAFDVIILDPPSLAKNKSHVKNAIKAYITLNSKALEKLPNDGILISSSCTSHISEDMFLKIIHQCSVNTHCILKVLFSSFQPYDHPYNIHFPEGRYLKFFIFQKSI